MFISVYGKGGIGKSTISSNLAVAFSKYGKKVLQIGCDPKHDSTFTIKHQMIPTIIEKLNEHDFHHEEINREDVIFEGYNEVNVVEAGGPPSGTGCAGYVVGEGIRLLENLNAFSQYDIIVFDVLGDIVCGGFSLPMNYSDYVLIVSKNDFDSLFAANRIIQGALEKSQSYPIKVAGIIANQTSTCEYIEEYAEIINTKIICKIKNDPLLKQSRFMGKTIYELSDEDPKFNYLKDNFNKIAKYILSKPAIENPAAMPEREMFEKFSNQRIAAN